MSDQEKVNNPSIYENTIPSGFSGGFFVYNALGKQEIFFADPNVIQLFECTDIADLRQLTGNSFRGMVYPEDLDQVESNILAQTFESGKRHDYVRYRIRTKNGNIRYIEDFGHLLHGENGQAMFYVYIADVKQEDFFNRSQNSYAEAQVFSMNKRIDPLTGLLKVTAFYSEDQEILLNQLADGGEPTQILIFDILGLRRINHLKGRDAGNACIVSLVENVREHLPKTVRLFRGDEAEIMAVCTNCEEDEIIGCAEAVVKASGETVLYGIGSTRISIYEGNNNGIKRTMKQAIEEAEYALQVKKTLCADSKRSHELVSLVRALEETDSDTEQHVQRTRRMGELLGKRIGLTDSQLTQLRLLCLLHDIGKISVPLEILNKPGKLSKSEWAVLREHAEKGYQIALSTEELKPIARLILCHHERWDGKGYPSGIAREAIPILSRIISVVDSYDAMVNDRSYRKALPVETAKKEIRDNAGTQFDPYLATEFLAMLKENPELAEGEKTDAADVRTFRTTAQESLLAGNTKPILYTAYVLDIDDVIIETDDYFETMTGYSREEAVGKLNQYELIPETDIAQYRQQVNAQFEKGDVAYLFHRIRCKDGTVKQVVCHGERYYDSSVKALKSDILVFEI